MRIDDQICIYKAIAKSIQDMGRWSRRVHMTDDRLTRGDFVVDIEDGTVMGIVAHVDTESVTVVWEHDA
jgi:hypothetical protein